MSAHRPRYARPDRRPRGGRVHDRRSAHRRAGDDDRHPRPDRSVRQLAQAHVAFRTPHRDGPPRTARDRTPADVPVQPAGDGVGAGPLKRKKPTRITTSTANGPVTCTSVGYGCYAFNDFATTEEEPLVNPGKEKECATTAESECGIAVASPTGRKCTEKGRRLRMGRRAGGRQRLRLHHLAQRQAAAPNVRPKSTTTSA